MDLETLATYEGIRRESGISIFQRAAIDTANVIRDVAIQKGEIKEHRLSTNPMTGERFTQADHPLRMSAVLTYCHKQPPLKERLITTFDSTFGGSVVVIGGASLMIPIEFLNIYNQFIYGSPAKNFIHIMSLIAGYSAYTEARNTLPVVVQNIIDNFGKKTGNETYLGNITNLDVLYSVLELHDSIEDTSFDFREVYLHLTGKVNSLMSKSVSYIYKQNEIKTVATDIVNIVTDLTRLSVVDRVLISISQLREHGITDIRQIYKPTDTTSKINEFNTKLDQPNLVYTREGDLVDTVSDLVKFLKGEMIEREGLETKERLKLQLDEDIEDARRLLTYDEIKDFLPQLNALLNFGDYKKKELDINQLRQTVLSYINQSLPLYSGEGPITLGDRESYSLVGKRDRKIRKHMQKQDEIKSTAKGLDTLENLSAINGLDKAQVAKVLGKYGTAFADLFSWTPLIDVPPNYLSRTKFISLMGNVIAKSEFGQELNARLNQAYNDLPATTKLSAATMEPYLIFRRDQPQVPYSELAKNAWSQIKESPIELWDMIKRAYSKKKILPLSEVREIISKTAMQYVN
jgi:hypothetical protein